MMHIRAYNKQNISELDQLSSKQGKHFISGHLSMVNRAVQCQLRKKTQILCKYTTNSLPTVCQPVHINHTQNCWLQMNNFNNWLISADHGLFIRLWKHAGGLLSIILYMKSTVKVTQAEVENDLILECSTNL